MYLCIRIYLCTECSAQVVPRPAWLWWCSTKTTSCTSWLHQTPTVNQWQMFMTSPIRFLTFVQGRCSTSSATGLKLVTIQCMIYIDMIGKIDVLDDFRNQSRRRCSVKIETKHSFFLAIGDLPVATMVFQFQTSIDGTLNNIFKVVPEVKGDKDVVSQPCALPCHVCSFWHLCLEF